MNRFSCKVNNFPQQTATFSDFFGKGDHLADGTKCVKLDAAPQNVPFCAAYLNSTLVKTADVKSESTTHFPLGFGLKAVFWKLSENENFF